MEMEANARKVRKMRKMRADIGDALRGGVENGVQKHGKYDSPATIKPVDACFVVLHFEDSSSFTCTTP